MHTLITGGAGYIGSHTCLALLEAGNQVTVLELVRAFEQASGRKVPHEVVARRPGDVAALWADPARARQLLGWSASRGIEAMCADTWRWQRDNPKGYA